MIDLDDPNYEAWLAALAKDCDCCVCCWEKPCGGCQQGGICDAMPCSREDDREHDYPDWDREDEEFWS